MDEQIKALLQLWSFAVASLTYCYFISSFIPKGKLRLLSLLPIFYFFTVLPLNLTSIFLGPLAVFFLTWLANFKLLLFCFDQGPLSSSPSIDPSISLPRFICIACLPIMLKPNQHSPPNTTTSNSKAILGAKVLIFLILTFLFKSRHVDSIIMSVCHCCHLYVTIEFILAAFASLVSMFLGVELKPQFNEPYLSTSLQDFWGKRWNLMVNDILRSTVYLPVRFISTKVLGRRWASLPATLSTFIVSGLMHELIFTSMGNGEGPTWEVASFFVLHGILVAVEIAVKKVMQEKWKSHPLLSVPFTLWILGVTAEWLFFPPMRRRDIYIRSHREVATVVNYFKNLGELVIGTHE